MAATHLVYPDLALDNFYGTESNQNADPSIQSKQRKSKFSRGDASPNLDSLAYCTFRKKALIFSLVRGSTDEWHGSNTETVNQWDDFQTFFSLDLKMDEKNSAIDWKLNFVFEELKRIKDFLPQTQKDSRQSLAWW